MAVYDPPGTPLNVANLDEKWESIRDSIEWRALELNREAPERTNTQSDENWGDEDSRDQGWQGAETALLERMPVELRETPASFRVAAQLPNDFSADDVDVSLDDGRLTIRGRRRDRPDSRETEGELVYSEFRNREVYRQIELPEPVEVDEVDVRFDGATLRIVVPKANREAA